MSDFIIYKNSSCCLLGETMFKFDEDSYIVSYDDRIVGYFNLGSGIFSRDNSVSLEYELLPKYRGKGLGNLFLETVEDYVRNEEDIDEIDLLIYYDNERSKKIAVFNNYKINYADVEMMDRYGEMTNYYPFSKILSR